MEFIFLVENFMIFEGIVCTVSDTGLSVVTDPKMNKRVIASKKGTTN